MVGKQILNQSLACIDPNLFVDDRSLRSQSDVLRRYGIAGVWKHCSCNPMLTEVCTGEELRWPQLAHHGVRGWEWMHLLRVRRRRKRAPHH